MSATILGPQDLRDAGDDATELPVPSDRRWRPLRAGLQNVWQYDHTTRFVFRDGRLLLRGRNGVGKTKVVEVLLPFLLEGSMQPNRLDPFGSRSRRMHFNLLHDGNADQQSAVAYVWLEFGRLDEDGTPRFATIGAGLKARRSSDQVESWFFTTDLRVDDQLAPVDDTRTPLSRPALEEALGDRGRVLATAREYRAAVNRLLFGLPAAQYEAMVDALLRLRQPHLSERLEPAELDAVLSDSLPPLDEDRLREVAEGFDRLEAHRTELVDRRRSLGAVEDFLALYAQYAAVVAAVRGRAVTAADWQVRSAAEVERVAHDDHAAAVAERDDIHQQLAGTTTQLRAAEERLATLRRSDAYRAVQDLDEAEGRRDEAAERLDDAEQRRASATDELAQARDQLAREDDELDRRRRQVQDTDRGTRAAAGDADLVDEHAGVSGQVSGPEGADGLDDATLEQAVVTAAGTVAVVAEARADAIAQVRREQSAVAEADHVRERAAAVLTDAVALTDDAEQQANTADQQREQAREAFADAVWQWSSSATAIDLDDDATEALATGEPEHAASAARTAAAGRRTELDDLVAAARIEVDRIAALEATMTAAREQLAAASHEPPAAPAWRTADRTDRPGAPLYMLIEFTDELDAEEQAGIEVALDALGLLDAWVMPDGTVLAGDGDDVFLVEGSGDGGRTLADVARPVPTDGMADDTVPSILQRIVVHTDAELVADDGWLFPDGGTAHVSTGGRFAMGPLDGRAQGTEVRFIGAAARERAREQRLAALDVELAEIAQQRVVADTTADAARGRRQGLDDELDAFPSAEDVVRARARADAAAGHLARARDQLAVADERHTAAVARLEDARARAAAIALDAGLAAHVDRLDELARASTAWRASVDRWLDALGRWADQRRLRDRVADQVAAAADRVRVVGEAVREATTAHDRLVARVATLVEMVGADPDDIRVQVRDAGESRDRHEHRRDQLQSVLGPAAERVGAAASTLEHATDAHAQAVDGRDHATSAFVALVDLGLLRVIGVDVDGAPDDWGVRAALDHARRVVAAGPDLPDAPDDVQRVLERAENRLTGGQQQLLRDAVGDLRPALRRGRQVWIPEVRFAGRLQLIDTVAEQLRADVVEREARLHDDEQGLLETFLTGELHEHLRTRLRDARALVDTMNARLADCATTAGHRVRLRWSVADDAAPGTGEAIDLLLRGRSLVTDDQRADLRTFLQERLRGAREGDAAASLQERIGNAFDYRRWHRFGVDVRERDGGRWRPLTRRSHGAGSGGEKAVMLHLPLFAAMAAHYEAAPHAPRLIVLDEVFAGIDRETRGQLMGLLVELDLDALLTSHDEWGFYAELDGLSTYHLIRDPGMPGVLAEWFVWDGARRWEMGV